LPICDLCGIPFVEKEDILLNNKKHFCQYCWDKHRIDIQDGYMGIKSEDVEYIAKLKRKLEREKRDKKAAPIKLDIVEVN
jgi:hypothetical protein